MQQLTVENPLPLSSLREEATRPALEQAVSAGNQNGTPLHSAPRVWYAGPVQTKPEKKLPLFFRHAMRPGRGTRVFLLFLLTAAIPSPAWAVQIHDHPEGYVVHMMAHIFFSAALIYFLYMLYKNPPGSGLAWKHLRLSLLLFLLWNIDTFTVHWLTLHLPDTAIIAGSNLTKDAVRVEISACSLLYYLGRFDHLLCVPAMWFLMCSLIDFCSETEKKGKQEAGRGENA